MSAKHKRIFAGAAFFAMLGVLVVGGVFIYNIGTLIELIKELTHWLVATIGKLGYAGIVALMFLESSFFPFPSEVVLPPAGYLAWKGEMSFAAVFLAGLAGSILGALFNYWFALQFGRPFLIKYGKYFFVSKESIDKAETFFRRHGHISTLVGRLLPVIRQYISLPAGIVRMNLGTFVLFTSIGAGLWALVLTVVGYLLGEHQDLLERYLHVLTYSSIACAVVLALGYLFWHRRLSREKRS
ncbi:MAG: DedA family protein [Synergistaceae bacterium]|jgi:membrane protein DedA with SNARE-associated domain|nr:DedA family protein [Synergistaceae bacterium]